MKQQSANPYDSEFCGNLPIHLINVIQPYGALLVVDKKDYTILQVSENIVEVLKQSAKEVIGKPVSDYFAYKPMFAQAKEKVPHPWEIMGKKYLAILHKMEHYYILEINLESPEAVLNTPFIDVYSELKETMNAIDRAGSLSEAAEVVVKELKAVSGFDKVMIYRFDEHWNGFVIAEAREQEMESYLHFTFPASDIPRQARELYQKNAYRFIPDRNYQPVKLFPVVNPVTNTFIDMSDCNLRGVSTVHVEYLGNMGVTASMSTRIIKDGELWGLIACHHREAMTVNYKMCAVFELLSGIISSKTSTLESRERHAFESALNETYTCLVEESYRSSDLGTALLAEEKNVLNLFSASGAALIHNNVLIKIGATPEDHELEDLVLWLNTRHTGDRIYVTDRLSREYDYAAEFREQASGLLAIPIDGQQDEYLLVFRPEVVKLVNWGGDPDERINFEKDMKTYHPRFSFKLWQEKVNGVSMPWRKEELEIAEVLRQFIQEFLNSKEPSFNQ